MNDQPDPVTGETEGEAAARRRRGEARGVQRDPDPGGITGAPDANVPLSTPQTAPVATETPDAATGSPGEPDAGDALLAPPERDLLLSRPPGRIHVRATVKLQGLPLGALAWVDPHDPYMAGLLRTRKLVPAAAPDTVAP